ncbi:hypothetical protein L345_13638, partial [Ophiophagus hannah]
RREGGREGGKEEGRERERDHNKEERLKRQKKQGNVWRSRSAFEVLQPGSISGRDSSGPEVKRVLDQDHSSAQNFLLPPSHFTTFLDTVVKRSTAKVAKGDRSVAKRLNFGQAATGILQRPASLSSRDQNLDAQHPAWIYNGCIILGSCLAGRQTRRSPRSLPMQAESMGEAGFA